MAIEMKFQNMEFNEGPNITIRKGIGWAIRLEWSGAEHFAAVAVDGSSRKNMEIDNIRILRLLDLKEMPELLELEHDPECREYNSLAFTMFEIYGHGKMSSYDIVTVIEFHPEVVGDGKWKAE